jgi:hypothetical protein
MEILSRIPRRRPVNPKRPTGGGGASSRAGVAEEAGLCDAWVPRRLRQGWAIGRAVALSFAAVMGATGPPEQPLNEYRVKAAFLYNFAKFVRWPPESFRSPADPIAICILGQDPFGRSLEDTVAGRTVEGRAFIVRHISSVKQAAGCHVLFAGSSERASPLLAGINTPGVLTVGETGSAASEGAIINFTIEEGRVRFTIDVAAAEREKLRISSRLLTLAVPLAR